MVKWLPWLGTDTEEVGSDYVKIEYNPNRVDFCSYSGVARAFRGLMGWETGIPSFTLKQGKITLTVDKSVAEVRPYVVSAIVRDLDIDYEAIRELMETRAELGEAREQLGGRGMRAEHGRAWPQGKNLAKSGKNSVDGTAT